MTHTYTVRISVSALALLLIAGCGQSGTREPPTQAKAASSPPAPQRSAVFGTPFKLGPWQATITTAECGTAEDMLGKDASNGQAPTDRVCVFAISYVNGDTVPHPFGSADNPDPTVPLIGYDGDGRAYDGRDWAGEAINPGLTGTNQLIFTVGPDARLRIVRIGEVQVTNG